MSKKTSPCECAVIFITSSDGVYLSKRLDATRSFFGVWQCPGGKLDPKETPKRAAVRELKEETGLNIKPTRLTFIGKNLRSFPDGSPYLAHNYHVELAPTELPIQTEPHKSSPWKKFKKNSISRLKLIPGLKDYLLSL